MGRHGVTLLIALLIAVTVATKLGQTAHADVGWYLYSAGAFLDGGRLYDDVFFEMNPPLMLYLTVPGVVLARLTGLFSVHAYFLTVFTVVAFSLWLTTRILPAPERQAGLVIAFVVLAILPAGDFGQRPHLMVCLALPYLLLVADRLHDDKAARGTLLAAAVGAIAGIGFAIKPHYLLVPAVLEAMLLWRRRRRLSSVLQPETLALGTVVASYAAAIAIFTPDYLTRAVPYALQAYDAYNNSLGFVLARPQTLLLPTLVLVYCRTRHVLVPPLAAIGDVFSVSAVTLFAVYVMQMKGWNYHLYPTTAMLVMLAGTIVTASPTAFRPVRIAILAAVLALVTKAALTSDNRYPLMDRLMPLVREHAADGAIYFFSSDLKSSFPMTLYANVDWASRFPSLWLLPGAEQRRRAALHDKDTQLLAEIDRFTIEAVIADLSASLPEIVFVDVRPRKPKYGDIDFDFIAHFSADPRFAALWVRYERIDEVLDFQVYRLRTDKVSGTISSARCELSTGCSSGSGRGS
jgi:hypothetical protein